MSFLLFIYGSLWYYLLNSCNSVFVCNCVFLVQNLPLAASSEHMAINKEAVMTKNKKYYFCFALIISICMTVLIQVFQLYSLLVLGVLELFMVVNVCLIAVNLFNRKCLNHVGTLIITGCLFLFLLWRTTFALLFLYSFAV